MIPTITGVIWWQVSNFQCYLRKKVNEGEDSNKPPWLDEGEKMSLIPILFSFSLRIRVGL